MRSLLCFVLLIVLVCATPYTDDALWKQWKQKFNKTYASSDEAARHAIWESHVAKIQAHNLRYQLGLETHSEGLNQFHDVTFEEFRSIYLRELTVPSTLPEYATEYSDKLAPSSLPASVDWRKEGLVTPIKNQGQCGSCWSFSTTGAMEGQWKLKSGQLVSLSESQLVDCSGPYGNYGCNGGWPPNAYRYVEVYGIEPETAYPYLPQVNPCEYKANDTLFKSKSAIVKNTEDEKVLQSMVATYGPISVIVHVSNAFMNYQGGILQDCTPQPLDHAVLAVGYGQSNGQAYWIVKNSWGTWWGENGYIRIARNRNNTCGIATWDSVPLL